MTVHCQQKAVTTSFMSTFCQLYSKFLRLHQNNKQTVHTSHHVKFYHRPSQVVWLYYGTNTKYIMQHCWDFILNYIFKKHLEEIFPNLLCSYWVFLNGCEICNAFPGQFMNQATSTLNTLRTGNFLHKIFHTSLIRCEVAFTIRRKAPSIV
jgi:hypothetical protein